MVASHPVNKSGPRRTYVGIDVSKKTLEVAAPQVQLKVDNTRTGFEKILRATRHLRYRQFICESSGQYERDLVAFLRTHRQRISIIPGFRSRQYAMAVGRGAKTDKIDAELLADLGEKLRPPPTAARPPSAVRLTEAVRFRRQLERLQQRLRRHREQQTNRAFQESIARVQKVLAKEIKTANTFVNEAIVAEPRFAWLRSRLSLVAGFGERATENLLGELPEIGRVNGKKIAALTGLAPMNYDSGTSVKSCRIFGGRRWARESLYMPALVAKLHNPILGAYYKRLRSAGKPHRVALVAVMRKLLVYLNKLASAPVGTPLPGAGVPVRRFRHWTVPERIRLRELRTSGKSMKQIALEMGRPFQSVQRRLRCDRGQVITPRKRGRSPRRQQLIKGAERVSPARP